MVRGDVDQGVDLEVLTSNYGVFFSYFCLYLFSLTKKFRIYKVS